MITIDTNILVHAHQREASLHQPAAATVKKCAEANMPWGICLHSMIEFYGVVTQPRLWQMPSTPAQALEQIAAWRESPTLRVLGDVPGLFDIIIELIQKGQVRGGMVHDARIAATCLVHGIDELWTVDRDFSRFPQLRTRNPLV
ncbi:MAG: PIN domain-containing protein [Deltaproteobacteria bacterium]|nr:PIN domain-containing protein [Deltaproteobacteria bacterium]